MSVSYWNDLKETRTKVNCDICIVGAGISGLSTAYWLKKEDPSLKVTVIDKGAMGSGATGRNAGFVTCGSVEHFNRMVSKHGEDRALEIWRFAEKNMNLLKAEIIGNEADKVEFEQKGAFSLAATDAEMTELKEVAKIMSRHKIPVETLNQDETSKRTGAEGFAGGILYKKDGAVNPSKLLSVLKRKTDCQLIENSEVFEVVTTPEDTRQVISSHHIIDCTIVIYCLNGYSQVVDEYFSDKIYPTRGQIMVLEPVKPFMEAPCYANFYLDYFRQMQDGSLLIGGFRQLEADTEKGFSDHTTSVIQRALHDFVIKHLPQFKGANVKYRWAGVMGFSADGEPMVGALPTDSQIFFCGGFTGHGLGLAFHTGKVLTDLIFGRPIPEWLSAKRF